DFHRVRAGAADEAAEDEGNLDHRGGLVQVDELQLVGRCVGALLGHQVLHLAADQAAAAGGRRELVYEPLGEGGLRGIGGGQQGEGVREESVAREQGGGLVEGLVRGGPTPAEV